MFGQTLVNERVVGGQQIHNVAVFTNNAVEQQLHFAPHGLAQWVIEIRIQHRQRPHRLQPAQVQPLAGEVDRQRLCTRVLQHTPHLLLKHRGIPELALARYVHQLVVRTAAPEEKRQS